MIFNIDYQNAHQIKTYFPKTIKIFILPPSLEELERKLKNHNTKDEPTTLRKLQTTQREIAHYNFFNYIIVNNQLDETYLKLRDMITTESNQQHHWAQLYESLLLNPKPTTRITKD
jgi:Guanylate kinase